MGWLRIAPWLLAAMMGSAQAQAHGLASPQIHLGAPVEPPRGFVELCTSLPALCGSFAGASAPKLPPAGMVDGTPAWVRRACIAALAVPERVRCGADGAGRPGRFARKQVVQPSLASADIPALRLPSLPALQPVFDQSLPASLTLPRLPDLPALPSADSCGGAGPGPGEPSCPLATAALADEALPALPPAASPIPVPSTDGLADDTARLRLLTRINDHVNARVHQQSDLIVYGVTELWRPSGDGPRAAGDCEDLALEKRVELLAAHFPPERLFMAVVYSFGAGLHAVLVARQDSGDVVLDSRITYILPWSKAPYSWLSVEVPGAPQEWRATA